MADSLERQLDDDRQGESGEDAADQQQLERRVEPPRQDNPARRRKDAVEQEDRERVSAEPCQPANLQARVQEKHAPRRAEAEGNRRVALRQAGGQDPGCCRQQAEQRGSGVPRAEVCDLVGEAPAADAEQDERQQIDGTLQAEGARQGVDAEQYGRSEPDRGERRPAAQPLPSLQEDDKHEDQEQRLQEPVVGNWLDVQASPVVSVEVRSRCVGLEDGEEGSDGQHRHEQPSHFCADESPRITADRPQGVDDAGKEGEQRHPDVAEQVAHEPERVVVGNPKTRRAVAADRVERHKGNAGEAAQRVDLQSAGVHRPTSARRWRSLNAARTVAVDATASFVQQ